MKQETKRQKLDRGLAWHVATAALEPIGRSEDGRPVYRRADVVAAAEKIADYSAVLDVLAAVREARP